MFPTNDDIDATALGASRDISSQIAVAKFGLGQAWDNLPEEYQGQLQEQFERTLKETIYALVNRSRNG